MASKFTGSPQAFRQTLETQFDPDQGEVVIETWHGPRLAILGLAAAFRNVGARVRTINRGPLWILTAQTGVQTSGQIETAQDRWHFDTEWAQPDIYSNPKILASAGSDDTLATWKKQIEAALKEGKTPTATGFAGTQRQLYVARQRGAEAYEVKRPVLARVRTISASYASPIVIDPVEKVYSSTALKSGNYFGPIPPAVRAQFPANPTAIDGTVWAWKLRRQSSETIAALNKTQEVTDWIFAAWDTLLYDVVAA